MITFEAPFTPGEHVIWDHGGEPEPATVLTVGINVVVIHPDRNERILPVLPGQLRHET